MNNNYDTALELPDARAERDAVQDMYDAARRVIVKLNRQIAAQHKYIEELEKQLEPSVVAEIRDALSAEKEE